jgi:hypothetical protein
MYAMDGPQNGTCEQRKEARIVAGRTGWIAFQKGARLRECFVGDESDNRRSSTSPVQSYLDSEATLARRRVRLPGIPAAPHARRLGLGATWNRPSQVGIVPLRTS